MAFVLFTTPYRAIRNRLKDKSSGWAGGVWITAMFGLCFFSSVNGPAEIRSSFARHHPIPEKARLQLARGDTASAAFLLRMMNMKLTRAGNTPKALYSRLYRFAGYGYRPVYSSDSHLSAD